MKNLALLCLLIFSISLPGFSFEILQCVTRFKDVSVRWSLSENKKIAIAASGVNKAYYCSAKLRSIRNYAKSQSPRISIRFDAIKCDPFLEGILETANIHVLDVDKKTQSAELSFLNYENLKACKIEQIDLESLYRFAK